MHAAFAFAASLGKEGTPYAKPSFVPALVFHPRRICNFEQKKAGDLGFFLTIADKIDIMNLHLIFGGENMLYSTETGSMVSSFGLEEGIGLLMDAGFKALDLSMTDHYDYIFEDDWKETADWLKNYAESRGVIFNQAHAPFGGGYNHYTTVLVPQMQRVFAFAGRLGIKTVVVHPLQRGRYYGHEQELFEMNLEFYNALAPLARDAGVRIGIENMWQSHPINHYIVDDVCANPYELCDYYDCLNAPDAFTVCLDIGHVALCGREPEDAIRILGRDRLGALHVHDVDYKKDLHTLPGLGKVNWDAVCDALAEVRYAGEITLEACFFLNNFDNELKPKGARFMCECAKHLAEKVERKMQQG